MKAFIAGIIWGIISILIKSQIDARVGTAQYPFVFYFWPVIVSSVFNGFLAGYTVLIVVSIYLIETLGLRSAQNIISFSIYLAQSAVIISLIEHIRSLRKRAQKDNNILDTIMENTNAHLAYLDPDFNFIKVNAKYSKSCGYSKSELYGQNHFKLFPHKENEIIFKKVRDSGKALEYKAKPFVNSKYPNQTTYWDWTLTPIMHNNSTSALVLSLLDVTEKIEEGKRKDDFLGLVSHEVKSPLTAIKGFSQIIQAGISKNANCTTCKMNRFAKLIELNVNTIVRLVNDLLDITRIRSGQLNYRDDSFCLDDLLNDICNTYRVVTLRHKIVYSGSKIGHIKADKERIGQVICNLIDNAIKYSPQAKEVVIRTGKNGKKFEIQVKDHGIGIDKKNIKNIFKPYYRIEGTGKGTKGLGLGLYLSSEIVRHYKGKIWAESKINHGTVFHVELRKIS